jgi:N-acetylglutamate synthase-like GNAT family acetyltransferase
MVALRPVSADAPELAAALTGAQLPIDDIADQGRTFFALDQAGQPVSYGGYELYGEDVLLRSVVVLPEQRGKGYGRAVIEAVLAEAAGAGARRAFLLTTTAAEFFVHEGFEPIERRNAPAVILATKQATTICATATLLTRSLT